MVRRLLTFLDLAQLDTSVLRGVGHDTSEAFRVHEMAAAARCEIASTRQQLHRTIVDFLVAAGCRIDGLAAFRERGRIEHDEVISAIVRRLELRQQVKDVRRREVHLAVKFIELGILTRLSDGKLGDIDRVHVLRPAVGGIQSKAARMREAIKNASSRRELRDGTPIVLLVEEEACLLSVLKIHLVTNAVFHNLRRRGTEHRSLGLAGIDRVERAGRILRGARKPSRSLGEPFERAGRSVVALIESANRDAVFGQHFEKRGEDHRLQTLHPHRKRLGYENILEAIDDKAGEPVSFGEQNAACACIGAHHRTNLALLGQQARPQIRPLAAHDIDD